MRESRRFEEVVVGEELPTFSREVRREDVASYADASGDLNPLHREDEAARAAGFPGVIAHGMLTMGHLASCISAWAGTAGAIESMRVSFRSAVLMGDVIEAGGRVRALDPRMRRATLEVWVRVERDGVEEFPIRRSEAEVRLA